MSYKTDNQIFADIIGIIRTFLSSSGQTGWAVVQGYQPRPLGQHDKLITLSEVYSVPVGFQGGGDETKYNDDGTITLVHVEKWREEVSIQIGCLCNRQPNTDTVATWSAVDMAKMLKTFFNSAAGIAALVTLGYGKLRIDNIRVGKFLNSSENFQLAPGFDLVLLHDQVIESAATEAVIKGAGIVGV